MVRDLEYRVGLSGAEWIKPTFDALLKADGVIDRECFRDTAKTFKENVGHAHHS